MKRIICKLLGHDPYYIDVRYGVYGLIRAYVMGCRRCHRNIETWHPEAFADGHPEDRAHRGPTLVGG